MNVVMFVVTVLFAVTATAAEEEISQIVQDLVMEVSPKSAVNDSDRLIDDLGFDELDLEELPIALEDKFAMEIEDDVWEKSRGTVASVIAYIRKMKNLPIE